MKWVLVTGVNSSIGFSISKNLVSKYNLIVSVRSIIGFEEKLEELKLVNTNILVWESDFNSNNLKADFQVYLKNQNLKISHFIHVSGYFSISPLRLINTDEMEKSFRVNVLSAIELCSVLAKKENKSELKNIIFISSISTIRGNAGYSLYASSKSALHGLSKSLSIELAPTKVNTIILGPVKTAKTASIMDSKEEFLEDHLPLGLTNEDVLNPWVNFLLENETWMTGQELIIDGGATVL